MPYPEYKAHATNTYNHALATVLNLMQSVPGNLETEDELRDWLRYPELAAPQYTSETIRAAIQYALVEYLPAPVKETPPPQRVPLKAPARPPPLLPPEFFSALRAKKGKYSTLLWETPRHALVCRRLSCTIDFVTCLSSLSHKTNLILFYFIRLFTNERHCSFFNICIC